MKDSRFKSNYGPWALITGASAGIGAAFAMELAAMGFNLVLVARRQSELNEVAATVRDKYGVDTDVIVADLTTTEGVEVVKTQSQQRDVGLLVASAGFGTSGSFLTANPATEVEMLEVNCRASILLAHAFGNRMKARGSGGIILMSSLLAWQGVPKAAHYAATKAYIQTFAEGLARELQPLGIDVLSSAPGPVLSGFGDRAKMRITTGVTTQAVAIDSLRALGKKTTVTPGSLSKLLTGSLATLPRGVRVRIMQQIMEGMTRIA